MNSQPSDQLANLTDVAIGIPSDVPWFVIAIRRPNRVFVADRRADASVMVTEGICEQFGKVIASETRGDWVAVLIDPSEGCEQAAAELRTAYALGTTGGSCEDHSGPF